MNEVIGDIWELWEAGEIIAIPTNGIVTNFGKAVMGAGIAKAAVDRFGQVLATTLGENINTWGNNVTYLPPHMVSFPTKEHFKDPSSITLIQRSALQLRQFATWMLWEKVYIPRVGCGKGRLSWGNVSPVLHDILDDRFTAVHPEHLIDDYVEPDISEPVKGYEL